MVRKLGPRADCGEHIDAPCAASLIQIKSRATITVFS
jgi:hypothetical protein